MKCYKEEIFGPVLVCLETKTLDNAISLINDNEYGNGVAIFTRSGAAAAHFQKTIEAGQVGINVSPVLDIHQTSGILHHSISSLVPSHSFEAYSIDYDHTQRS